MKLIRLSASVGSRLFGNTVSVGLARRGGHEHWTWRLLEHLQRDAAAQPGRKLAAARGAEDDQVGTPLGGFGGDLLGGLADQGVANLPRGGHACHAKLKDCCLGGVGGRGVRLEREAPAAVAFAQVEVQDAGLAHAGAACQFHYGSYLAGIGDRDEHSLVKGRRRGLRVGRQGFAVNRRLARHVRLLTLAARALGGARVGSYGCNRKADELDSKLPDSNAVQPPPPPGGAGVNPGADSSPAEGCSMASYLPYG